MCAVVAYSRTRRGQVRWGYALEIARRDSLSDHHTVRHTTAELCTYTKSKRPKESRLPRRCFDLRMRVTAPPWEGRKEGAKHIKRHNGKPT